MLPDRPKDILTITPGWSFSLSIYLLILFFFLSTLCDLFLLTYCPAFCARTCVHLPLHIVCATRSLRVPNARTHAHEHVIHAIAVIQTASASLPNRSKRTPRPVRTAWPLEFWPSRDERQTRTPFDRQSSRPFASNTFSARFRSTRVSYTPDDRPKTLRAPVFQQATTTTTNIHTRAVVLRRHANGRANGNIGIAGINCRHRFAVAYDG